jgi:hypothetical protein
MAFITSQQWIKMRASEDGRGRRRGTILTPAAHDTPLPGGSLRTSIVQLQ